MLCAAYYAYARGGTSSFSPVCISINTRSSGIETGRIPPPFILSRLSGECFVARVFSAINVASAEAPRIDDDERVLRARGTLAMEDRGDFFSFLFLKKGSPCKRTRNPRVLSPLDPRRFVSFSPR